MWFAVPVYEYPDLLSGVLHQVLILLDAFAEIVLYRHYNIINL